MPIFKLPLHHPNDQAIQVGDGLDKVSIGILNEVGPVCSVQVGKAAHGLWIVHTCRIIVLMHLSSHNGLTQRLLSLSNLIERLKRHLSRAIDFESLNISLIKLLVKVCHNLIPDRLGTLLFRPLLPHILDFELQILH